MDKGYLKVYWGLAVASIVILYPSITILPAFIGWVLLFMGLNALRKNSASTSYDWARLFAALLVFVSFAELILTLFLKTAWNDPLVFLYYPLFPLMLELLLMINLLKGSGESLLQISKDKEYEKLRRNTIIYLLLVLIAAVLITFTRAATNELYAGLGGLVTTFSRIQLLDTFNGLKKTWKEYEHTETSDPSS